LLPDLAQSTAGLPIVPALIPQASSRFDSARQSAGNRHISVEGLGTEDFPALGSSHADPASERGLLPGNPFIWPQLATRLDAHRSIGV